MRSFLACLAAGLLLGACATTEREGSGRYVIPAQYANAPRVPYSFAASYGDLQRLCDGRSDALACAIDRGTDHCHAVLAEWFRIVGGEQLDYAIRHESAHCAGWHHQGE